MAATSSVNHALDQWRERLLDLSSRNPLISLNTGQSSALTITQPGVGAIVQRLVGAKQAWRFWMPPSDDDAKGGKAWDASHQPPQKDELVCGAAGRRRLRQNLTALFRRARDAERDHGQYLLHLAAGLLDWRDGDDEEALRSPLVLVPVQ